MIKESFKSVGILFKYAKYEMIFKLIGVVFTGLTTPLIIICTQKVIDSMDLFFRGLLPMWSVGKWTIILLVAMFFSASAVFLNDIQNINLKRKLNKNFTNVILSKYKNLEYWCFENPDIQDTLSRVGNDPQHKILDFFINITNIISMLISIVGLALIFTKVSIWLAICFLGILLLIMRLDYKAMSIMNTLFEDQTIESRRLNYLSSILSDKNSLFELKVFGALEYIKNKLKKKSKRVLDERLKLTIISQKYFAISSVCIISWIGLVVFALIYAVTKNQITIGLFISLVGSAGLIILKTEELSSAFSNYSKKYLELKHFNVFMNLPEIRYGEDDWEIKNPQIKFENVVFRYPNTKKTILDGISFEIQAKERVAIVGPNGAGKSTIVKLLCRLYKPDSGRILIDGIDINLFSQKKLQRVFSIVFQDFANYYLTLRENIALGNIEKLNDDNSLRTALKNGLAERFINNLDMNLGKIEENGIELSGGEWQRIAISRAFIADSAFVILDEPTASLDPIAESDMYRSFISILKSRGSILISHRLASAKMSDKIIVINEGKVAENGSHDALMSNRKIYASMWESQSSWYKKGDLNEEKI